MRSGRAGTTLVELVVAIVVLALVAGAIHGLLLGGVRTAREHATRTARERTLRSAAALIANELRGLAGNTSGPIAGDTSGPVVAGSASTSDVVAANRNDITYRAPRGLRIACDFTATAVLVRHDADWTYGYRDPQPGRDSLLLFVDGDPDLARDDRWIPLPLLGTAAARCGTQPARALVTTLDSTLVPPGAARAGAPVHLFETMELRLYHQGPHRWLGARSASAGEPIQPAFGPFASDGVRFDHAATTTVSLIAEQPDGPPSANQSATSSRKTRDSLRITIHFRNAP